MQRNDWMDLARRLAREGDNTSDLRRQMLDAEVRSYMDDMSQATRQKVEDDKRRGIIRRTA